MKSRQELIKNEMDGVTISTPACTQVHRNQTQVVIVIVVSSHLHSV